MKGNTWATLSYFFSLGFFYGALLGAYIGTSFLPILGTVVGVFCGVMVGVVCGLISGVIASVIQARSFHNDIDLESYSRTLARIIGVVVSVSAVALMWAYSFIAFTDAPAWERQFVLTVLLVSSVAGFLLGGLSAAYTAYDYPALMLHRLSKKGKLEFAHEVIPPDRDEIHRAFNHAIHLPPRLANRILIIVGILSYIGLFIAVLRQGPITDDDLPVIFFAGPIGASAAIVIWAYCAYGNAMVITFLKRVLYHNYLNISAHRYRVSLTLISFVLTWLMIWWTTLPGPIIAGIMAYSVYHTLALPDESPEKAKRKEKNALALEEDIDEEGEDEILLMGETIEHKQVSKSH